MALAALAAGELWAQPTVDHSPTITGTVVDERGAGAPDVEVVLRPYPSDYEVGLQLWGQPDALPEAVDRTRSGPDGAFSLSASRAGPYRLEFWPKTPADQAAPTQPVVFGSLMPLQGAQVAETIEVPNLHPVAVRVLDVDGQPLEGALVIATPTAWVSPRSLSSLTRMVRDAQAGNYSRPQAEHVMPTYHPSASRTDADGIARFLMPTEDADVLVLAPSFVLGKAKTKSGRAAFRLERDPGIRLRVRGPNGAPAPGVLIGTPDTTAAPGTQDALSLLRSLGASGDAGTPSLPLAVTDGNGEAVVSRVAGSQTTWELEAADYAFAEVSLPAPNPADPPPGEQIVDVRLEAPLRLPGRVVDNTSGLPIDGAAIWVYTSPGDNAYSDPTGAFDLSTSPAPTGMRLRVTAGGYISERTDITATEPSNQAEVRIGLTPAAPIRGLVTDSAGQPVSGAKIRAEPRGAGVAAVPSYVSGPSTSAPDGSFQVTEAVYGYTYRLTAQAPGYANTALDLPPLEPGLPIEPVQIVLSKGRRVLGTVVDTEGNPVAEAQVSLLWPLDQSDFRSFLDAPATAAETNDQGAFVIPAAAPGDYEVDVAHTDYAKRPTTKVEVPAGESDFELGDLTLVAGTELHGIVTGADGEPAAGATIQVLAGRPGSRSVARTATTDTDGRFRVGGLSSELADLGVRATGYPLLVLPGVRAGNDEPVLIELKPGASVTGHVLDNGGNAVAGVPVRLRIERNRRAGGDPRLWGVQDMFPRRVTDRDGRFRFDGLAAGTWSAEARKEADGAKTEAIELAPGAQREIELVLRTRDLLRVSVTTPLGEPVAGAVIEVKSEGEARLDGMGWTDARGQTEIGISPGPVTARWSTRSSGTRRGGSSSRRVPTNSSSNSSQDWRSAARSDRLTALFWLWRPLKQ